MLLDDRVGETTPYADHVLAAGSHFESAGSFVNRDGRIQRFDAATDPPGRAVEGWQALASLLEALGGPAYDSVEAVREAVLSRLGAEGGSAKDLGAEGLLIG